MNIWILEDSDWGQYCVNRIMGGDAAVLKAIETKIPLKFRVYWYKDPNDFCNALEVYADETREYYPHYIFLDHDLGNVAVPVRGDKDWSHLVPQYTGNCKDGGDAAKYLAEHASRLKFAKGGEVKVIITSGNTVAAGHMFKDLAKVGFDVDIKSREIIFDDCFNWPWLKKS